MIIKNFFTINKLILLLSLLLTILVVSLIFEVTKVGPSLIAPNLKKSQQALSIRSIDTVKYSRDFAREKKQDLDFDKVITQHVSNIADTNATHIALGVPYDEEFIPFLKRWISVARKHNLKIWFRGNFSGWEEWFGYKKIDRATHIELTKEFILKNAQLFEDGDIFTPCPECENGGPGDPRHTKDVSGHRFFLISEYNTAKEAFSKIGKKVLSGYYSMNGDVAQLIMDKQTTAALGAIVVVDHYVKTPKILIEDIKNYAKISGGKVVLGEFGVPIPDINGKMSEEEQAKWLEEAFEEFKQIRELIGVNYWVSYGGTTELWRANGQAKQAVEVIKKYYSIK